MATLSKAVRILLTLFTIPALAHTSRPADDPKVKLFCEYGLSGKLALAQEDEVFAKLFAREFRFEFLSDSSELALKELGLPSEFANKDKTNASAVLERTEPGALHPLRVRLTQEQSELKYDLKTFDFPDEQASLWHYLVLPVSAQHLPHHSLRQFYPPQNAKFHLRKLYLGFHTDFDKDGVRRYVAFDGEDELELGLDVPCEKAKNYLQSVDLSSLARVRTPITDLCRVPVMYFTAE